jgi:shikimate kinase
MNVILIGYMGCGKTTIGKTISHLINNKYYDLDDYIVYHEKKSMKIMLVKNNDKYFRHIESIILKKFLGQETKYILSVGGGTPCYNDNMYLMNQFAKTIYLQVSCKKLLNRLHHENKYRPIISIYDPNKLNSFILKHFSNRKLFYEYVKKKINIIPSIYV